MKHMLGQLAIAAITVLASQPALAQLGDASSTSILIAPERETPSVNLYRAGRLSEELDQRQLAAIGELPSRSGQDVDLLVDGEGRPTDCIQISKAITSDQANAMCSALTAGARAELPSWYDLAGWPGRIGIRFGTQPAPTHAPVLPLEKGTRGATAELAVTISTYDDGDAPECSAWPVSTVDMRLSAADRVTVCDALVGDASALQALCLADGDPAETRRRYICKLAARPLSDPLQRLYTVAATDDYLGRPLVYRRWQPAESPMLRPEEGTLRPEISSRIQYPSRALRQELEGTTTVTVGISSNGRISTCRPIESSGHLILDVHTCRSLVRYARYRFEEEYSEFEGLKYQIIPLVWSIPE